MDRFARNATLLLVAELTVRIKSLLLLPLVTHELASAGYGAYSQVFVIVGFLTPIVTLGTENGVVRYLPSLPEHEQRARFAGWLRAVLIVGGFVCVVVAVLREPVSALAFGDDGAAYQDLAVLSAGSLVVAIVLAAARTWCRIRDDAKTLAVVTVSQAVWSGGVVVVLVLVATPSPFTLLVTSVAGDAVIAVAVLLRGLGVRPRIDTTLNRQIVRYSLPLLPSAFAVWALNMLDRVFLVRYSTLAEVGRYSLAYSLAYLPIQVVVNPVWAMFPNVAAQLHSEQRRRDLDALFHRSTRAVVAFCALAVSITAVLGDAAMRFTAPDDFARAAPVLPIVTSAYALLMLSAYSEILLGLRDRQHWSTISTVAAVVVNTALNVALIPPHGAVGAALATLVAACVQIGIVSAVARRHDLPMLDLLHAARCLVAGAATGGMCAASRTVVDGAEPMVAIGLAVIGVGTFLGVLRLLGVTASSLVRTRALTSDGHENAAEVVADAYGSGASEGTTIRP